MYFAYEVVVGKKGTYSFTACARTFSELDTLLDHM